jgi:hypothetical protein
MPDEQQPEPPEEGRHRRVPGWLRWLTPDEDRAEPAAHPPGRRVVRAGEEYSGDEDAELEQVEPRRPEPPPEVQGEPWGWTKPGDKPKGWREDGRYGPQNRDDPGPLDGRWPDEPD